MGKILDITNERFGKLTALKRDNTKKGSYWICKCDCGNIKTIRSDHLRNGETKSCGCLQKEKASKIGKLSAKDYTGIQNGWITILEPLNYSTEKSQNRYWKAKCKCGRIVSIPSSRINKTLSCGCRPQIDYTNKEINNFKVIEFLYSDKIKGPIWKCRCNCGSIFECPSKYLPYRKSCGCISSYKEEEIVKILNENNLSYKRQYTFSDLYKNIGYLLRFDFAIFKNEKLIFLIEYQGRQHYDKNSKYYSKEIIENDKLKIKYCQINKIPLLILDKNSNLEKEIIDYYDTFGKEKRKKREPL